MIQCFYCGLLGFILGGLLGALIMGTLAQGKDNVD